MRAREKLKHLGYMILEAPARARINGEVEHFHEQVLVDARIQLVNNVAKFLEIEGPVAIFVGLHTRALITRTPLTC